MKRIDDPLKLIADLRPAVLDDLADSGYAKHRHDDLARASAESGRSMATSPGRHPGAPRRGWSSGLGRTRALLTAAVALAAAGATAAALVSGAPPVAQRKVPVTAPRPHPSTGRPATARQVLLTAAHHVLRGPAGGAYWRVQVISGLSWPAGTTAHPYDITVSTGYDQWNPRIPGHKEVLITRQLSARPATPADAQAWQAAGSPTKWHSGQYSPRGNDLTLGAPWGFNLAATTAAPAPTATWTISDGTVGYIEGDEAGLTAAQFARMPTQPKALAAILRHYAKQTPCGKHRSSGCSSVNQIVWQEALYLLEDPVSAQVRSATFKVMASLPGVRLLGPMTDPLGRSGYALAAGPLNPGSPYYKAVSAVLIDPATGSLLATEDIAPMPRSVKCWIQLNTLGPTKCLGSSYLGRSYPGQVGDFVALVSAGWTDAKPSLPRSTHEDPTGYPGLPPAGP
jgi:hypothetical protein